MIPTTINLELTETSDIFETPSSQTYRMDFENRRIIGKVDGKDAVLQAIRKRLRTDKYAWEIYDWYYGNELFRLVSMPYEYIVVEAPRIITEALLVDDRILEISKFSHSRSSIDSIFMEIEVRTVYGDISFTVEVAL